MPQQMCRTCLSTCGELVPIFSDNYYVHDLRDKLFHTTKIKVLQDDNLPKMMCKKCIFLVDSLCCFKDQCEMAEIKLKRSIKSEPTMDATPFVTIATSNNRNYDSRILGKAEDHSDAITSSEEEYQIEYASEEARLEVENARKVNRNSKKKRNKHSGVKVKSVEIIPPVEILSTESPDGIYKPLTVPSFRTETSEINENINISNNEDLSSLLVDTEDSSKLMSDALNRKNPGESISFTEKISLYKTLREEKLKNLKRKIEQENNLSKAPKKIAVDENNYITENVDYMEISGNQTNTIDESSLVKMEDQSIEIDANIENNLDQNILNYDIEISKDLDSFDNSMNSQIESELSKTSPDNETKKLIEERMQNLIQQVVLDIPETCAICLEHFESHIDVLQHKIKVHLSADQDYFFCPICCEKFFSNDNLVEHLCEHPNIHTYICILCSGNFYTDDTLRTHLLSHADLRDAKCKICSKRFQRMPSLLTHLNQHITAKQLICALCSDSYSNKDLLQQHIDEDHKKNHEVAKVKCETCGLETSKEKMEAHTETHNVFPCPYCERTFSMKTNLRDHVFTHLGVQQYSCLACEKTFISQEERTAHMQEHMKPQQKQNDRKKFRCRVCHEILISRVAYGQHLKEKHWNAKQTSEILRELSESSMNEKVNEQLSKSSAAMSTSDNSNLT